MTECLPKRENKFGIYSKFALGDRELTVYFALYPIFVTILILLLNESTISAEESRGKYNLIEHQIK